MKELSTVLPSNKKFGLTIGTIFILLSLIGPVKFHLFGGIGLLLIFFALFIPDLLSAPNKAWMRFGDLIHKITNPVIMLLLYFTVFCPIGFTLQLYRHLTTEEGRKNNIKSYWKNKENPDNLSSMKNQF